MNHAVGSNKAQELIMNVVEKTGRYAKWKELIAEHAKSGLSRVAFCKHHHLSVSKFKYYSRVIPSQEKRGADNVFSAIQIKPPEPCGSSDIKILLPNGFQCIISSTTPVSPVKRLLEVLLSC
jgi:hypothetical protein